MQFGCNAKPTTYRGNRDSKHISLWLDANYKQGIYTHKRVESPQAHQSWSNHHVMTNHCLYRWCTIHKLEVSYFCNVGRDIGILYLVFILQGAQAWESPTVERHIALIILISLTKIALLQAAQFLHKVSGPSPQLYYTANWKLFNPFHTSNMQKRMSPVAIKKQMNNNPLLAGCNSIV